MIITNMPSLCLLTWIFGFGLICTEVYILFANFELDYLGLVFMKYFVASFVSKIPSA